MRKIDVEQGTPEWHDERFGSVTGTRIQSAVGAKWDARKKEWKLGDEKVQHTLLCEIVSERMSQNEVIELNTRAVERGNELEPFAIKSAAEFNGVDYQVCGMLACEFIDHLKFSPDAIFEEDGVIIGGLETKCPNGKKHIEYMIDDVVPREYFWQVICPFILSNEVQWWDFASYDDRNYERELFPVRIYREDVQDLVLSARDELIKFLDKVEETHTELTF